MIPSCVAISMHELVLCDLTWNVGFYEVAELQGVVLVVA